MKLRSPLSTILTAAALAATLGLAGCSAGGGSDYLAADNSDRASQITSAIDELSAAVGEDAQITDLSLFTDYVSVSAVDPAATEELNQWTLRSGKMEDSVPVDYGSDVEALKENLFPLSEVDPAVVAKIIDDAPEASQFDDLTVQAISLSYPMVAFSEDEWQPVFTVTLDGERDDETLTFDLAGKQVTA